MKGPLERFHGKRVRLICKDARDQHAGRRFVAGVNVSPWICFRSCEHVGGFLTRTPDRTVEIAAN